MNEDQVADSKRTGRIFLACILGFFLTFMIVDAFFVYQALSTSNGTVELIHGK